METERLFAVFLNYLSTMVCPQKCQNQFAGDHCRYRSAWTTHSKGSLVRILADGPSVREEVISAWAEDTEHGLFHGIMTAFFAFLYKYPDGLPNEIYQEQNSKTINTPIDENEFLISSCLVHDFVRSSIKEEPHDQKLKEWFFSLDESTYTHSVPPNISPLVVGDRWELLRFSDYSEWLDENKLNMMPKKLQSKIKSFHQHIRPALEKMIAEKNDVWFRHSPEKLWENHNFKKLTSESCYPPKGYWNAREDDDSYFAVETGTMPPRGCLLHGYARNNSLDNTDPSSYSPYGMINLKSLKQYSDKNKKTISPCVRVTAMEDVELPWENKNWLGDDWANIIKQTGYAKNTFISRDHLAASSEVPLKEWIFLYDDNKFTKNPELIKRAEKRLLDCWLFLKNSKGLVKLQLATNFIEIFKQIETILIALRT